MSVVLVSRDVVTRMRMARRGANLRQQDIADDLGWSIEYVQAIERGVAEVPLDEARAWAEACNRSLAWLLLDPKRRAPWGSTYSNLGRGGER